MKKPHEVNRGYIPYITGLAHTLKIYRLISWLLLVPRILLFPAVVLYSLSLLILLSILRKYRYNSRLDQEMIKIADNARYFIDQYPFHYYPLVSKSLLLYHVRLLYKDFPFHEKSIVELAIGEGSFSRLVFHEQVEAVDGFDLSPYSLSKCKPMKHVRNLIVADCLTPPILPGSVDRLHAMNFIHHVTEKSQLLHRWSLLSDELIMNEDTEYWATSSVGATLLRLIGLKKLSALMSGHIEKMSHQCLMSQADLRKIVSKDYDLISESSFMNSFVMFLSNISACLMVGIYGPPTPSVIKVLSRGILKKLILKTAKELIFLDLTRPRNQDVFVLYHCKSRNYKKTSEEVTVQCPTTGSDFKISTLQTSDSVSVLKKKGGLYFLLEDKLKKIYTNFSEDLTTRIPEQHL